jgi:ABC-type glycerol-3-phosphate transport system substrate-binding protein
MKKSLFLFVFVFALIALVACGAQQATEEAPAVEEPAAEMVEEAPVAEAEEQPAAEEAAPAEEMAEEPVVLTVVTHETEVLDAAFWQEVIDAVLADLDANINVEWSSTADRDAYAKQLAATDQFPDIPFAVTVADFAEAGLLVPFDQAYLDENFILPNASKVDGKAYSPPVGAQLIPLVFYNKAIFEEVGGEVPTTWDEFITVSQALLDAGYVPMQMCAAEPWCASFPGVGLVSQNVFGDDPEWMLKRKAGEVSFSDPEFVAAMQKLADMVEAGYIDAAGALGTDFATANQNFYDGNVPMYMQGSWFIAYPPDDMGFEMGAFVLPRDDGQIIPSIYVGGGTRVSAVSEHPEELMMFAEEFEKNMTAMHMVVQSDAMFPMLKNKTIEDYNVDLPDLFYDYYNNVVANDEVMKVPAFTWANNDYDPIPGWKDEFYASIQNILLGEDVASEMARLDQVWDETAQRLGLNE